MARTFLCDPTAAMCDPALYPQLNQRRGIAPQAIGRQTACRWWRSPDSAWRLGARE